MKTIHLLLFLTAPIMPKWTYEKLKNTKFKLVLSLVYLIVVFGVILYLNGIVYNSRPQHLGYLSVQVPFKIIGLAVWIIVLSLTSVLMFKTQYIEKLKFIDVFAIISVSTLPLTIGSIIEYIFISIDYKRILIGNNSDHLEIALKKYDDILKFFNLIGGALFGILMAYGISTHLKIGFLKSIIKLTLVFVISILLVFSLQWILFQALK